MLDFLLESHDLIRDPWPWETSICLSPLKKQQHISSDRLPLESTGENKTRFISANGRKQVALVFLQIVRQLSPGSASECAGSPWRPGDGSCPVPGIAAELPAPIPAPCCQWLLFFPFVVKHGVIPLCVPILRGRPDFLVQWSSACWKRASTHQNQVGLAFLFTQRGHATYNLIMKHPCMVPYFYLVNCCDAVRVNQASIKAAGRSRNDFQFAQHHVRVLQPCPCTGRPHPFLAWNHKPEANH